jgi:hypothetical protein
MLGALLLLALADCTGRIWRENGTADGITLHWYTREVSMDEATGEAHEHCEAYGRRSRLVRVFEDQDTTTANFACLPASS